MADTSAELFGHAPTPTPARALAEEIAARRPHWGIGRPTRADLAIAIREAARRAGCSPSKITQDGRAALARVEVVG